jgi:hypothetical protein
MGRFNRRRTRRYGACPECTTWSILIQPNGRVVRHTIGFGYVERFPPNHPFRPGKVCKGSGALVLERLPKEQWYR